MKGFCVRKDIPFPNILAVFNSAFQCSQCLKFCHKQCCETADSISPCSGSPDSSNNQELIFSAFPVNRSLAENSAAFYENYIKSLANKREESARHNQQEVSFSSESYARTISLSDLDGTVVIPGDRKMSVSLYDANNGILSNPGLLTVIVQQARNIQYSGVFNS